MKINKIFAKIFLFITVISIFTFGIRINDIIAKSDKYRVTCSEVEDYIKYSKLQYDELFGEKEWKSISESKKDKDTLITNTINNILLNKIHEKILIENKIYLSNEEIDKYLSLSDRKELADKLDNYGISSKFLEKNIRAMLLEDKYKNFFQNKVEIGDRELKEYYDMHRNDFIINKTKLYQIWIKKSKNINGKIFTPEEISNIAYKELESGVPFKKVSDKYSQDERNLDGGSLGYVEEKDLIKELRYVVDLQEGSCTKPVKTDFGYFIVKVGSKQLQKNDFADSKNKIVDILRKEKFDNREKMLLKENKVNINKARYSRLYKLF